LRNDLVKKIQDRFCVVKVIGTSGFPARATPAEHDAICVVQVPADNSSRPPASSAGLSTAS